VQIVVLTLLLLTHQTLSGKFRRERGTGAPTPRHMAMRPGKPWLWLNGTDAFS